MKTIQLVFHFQGIHRFNLAVVDDEPILYTEDTMTSDDRDFWLTTGQVESFLAGPFDHAGEAVKKLLASKADWTIEVTEYTALEPTKYQAKEIEARAKARRRNELLSKMAPEDRALFT